MSDEDGWTRSPKRASALVVSMVSIGKASDEEEEGDE